MSRPAGCAREPEAVEAVMLGAWPARVDRELSEHVGGCGVCQQVVALATAFEVEVASAHAEAAGRLPDGRLVWWRAQVRARQEARRAAVQPITAAGVLAVAAVTGAAAGLLGLTAGFLGDWYDRATAVGASMASTLFTSVASDVAAWPSAVATLAANHSAVAVVIVSCLGLAPLVLYVALREE